MAVDRPDAMIVLAHGSPDADWMLPIEAIARRLRRAVPRCVVLTAALEHGPTLAEAVRSLRDAGRRDIAVIPVFLSDGGKHMKRDIPAMITALQQTFFSVSVRLASGALGADEAVLDALADAALRHTGYAT